VLPPPPGSEGPRGLYIPGLVPGAGSALTGGAALGITGNEGGGAIVLVVANVIRGGDVCAICMTESLDLSVSRPTAPIATAPPTPIAASADLYRAVFNRCEGTMSLTLDVR
jgi:hypothetical protein